MTALPYEQASYAPERIEFFRRIVKRNDLKSMFGFEPGHIDDVIANENVQQVIGKTIDGYVLYTGPAGMRAALHDMFESWVKTLIKKPTCIGKEKIYRKGRAVGEKKKYDYHFDPRQIEFIRYVGFTRKQTDLLQ